MQQTRRNFFNILSGIALAFTSFKLLRLKKQVVSKASLFPSGEGVFSTEKVYLKNGSCYKVVGGEVLWLPESPVYKEQVYIANSPNRAWSGMASIRSKSDKIVGKNESLELDTLANFSLLYMGNGEGWVLG